MDHNRTGILSSAYAHATGHTNNIRGHPFTKGVTTQVRGPGDYFVVEATQSQSAYNKRLAIKRGLKADIAFQSRMTSQGYNTPRSRARRVGQLAKDALAHNKLNFVDDKAQIERSFLKHFKKRKESTLRSSNRFAPLEMAGENDQIYFRYRAQDFDNYYEVVSEFVTMERSIPLKLMEVAFRKHPERYRQKVVQTYKRKDYFYNSPFVPAPAPISGIGGKSRGAKTRTLVDLLMHLKGFRERMYKRYCRSHHPSGWVNFSNRYLSAALGVNDAWDDFVEPISRLHGNLIGRPSPHQRVFIYNRNHEQLNMFRASGVG
jgi:hypothetical protein